MKEIWLFNPDSDMALASGDANYMAPFNVRKMAEDLALLPMWYARDGGFVLATSAYNQPFLQSMQEFFQISVQLITPIELSHVTECSFHPWGWNVAVLTNLLRLGVPQGQLPARENIDNLKTLSSRKIAVGLLPYLQLNERFCGRSIWLDTLNGCKTEVELHNQYLLKQPLSGSGKGLNWCKGQFTDNIAGWCKRVIQLQGGVVGEFIYNKKLDFAMEFYSKGSGDISFVGYSLFQTSQSGFYDGNILVSDEYIESVLSEYVSLNDIHDLRTLLINKLSAYYLNNYVGYLGVDMMICQFESTPHYRIHPCVEINLRMNMGVLSRFLYTRYVTPSRKGVFKIEYHVDGEQLKDNFSQLADERPLQLHENRVASGYLPLTPISPHTQYHAFILVE